MTIPNGMAMGFEVDTTVLHYFTSTSITGTSTITIGAGGRNSTQGLLALIPNNTNSSNAGAKAVKTLPAALSTIYQSFAFSTNVLPVASQAFILLELRESGTVHIDVRLFPDGTLRVTRAGTALGTGSFVASVNVFYHVEMKAVIDDSTGTIDILVNGASILSLTGQDTKNGGAGTVTEITIGATMITNLANQVPATTVKFDDMVTNDAAFLGDCRVREDLPTGTGSVDDGVATGAADSRQATDEAPPDNDTTYAELVNVGDKILLTYATIPTTEEVVAAGMMPYAKKSTAGAATFKTNVKIGATEYTPGADQAPSAGSYAYFQDLMMVSPATSAAFTATELNGAEIGIEKTS
jgi:hypothetical protein